MGEGQVRMAKVCSLGGGWLVVLTGRDETEEASAGLVGEDVECGAS